MRDLLFLFVCTVCVVGDSVNTKKNARRANPFTLDQLPSFLVPFRSNSNGPSQAQLAAQLSQPVPGNLQVADAMQDGRGFRMSDTGLRLHDLNLQSMISPRQALGNRWTQLDNVADFSNSGMEIQERNNPPIQALSSLLTGDDTTAATNQAQLVAVHQAKLQSMYDGIGRQEKQIRECNEFIVKLTQLNEKNKLILQSNKDKLKAYSDELVALVGRYTDELQEDRGDLSAGTGGTGDDQQNAAAGAGGQQGQQGQGQGQGQQGQGGQQGGQQGQQGKGQQQQGKGQQQQGGDEKFTEKLTHLKKSVPHKKHWG